MYMGNRALFQAKYPSLVFLHINHQQVESLPIHSHVIQTSLDADLLCSVCWLLDNRTSRHRPGITSWHSTTSGRYRR